ncbi:MAG TPA: hypothetical protein DDX39_05230 [Bacteroidales bacterium]|nr:MAG: hypothetical protein A2W98_10950 [Bacteroidetes bacterium GWF2_33_38]OFY76583.1 MAG: hypothetical protein A2265_11105 [Bacteroidetes bacterium RIFOXYA12_FULL_33_9]OFY90103.1 MAG: hypothetical protein A2236_01435 [Bacteroidetes bacterium RIFOXYA2_FULL_33_7]HBF88028.1 hypothetical protein [Bacteroidales bacterium]
MNFINLRLAWRNIWRNKRRTIITASSIMFAIFFALIMRSQQLGAYQNMTDSIVKTYTGFIQIHAKGFWKDKTLEYLFENDEKLLNKISENEHVTMLVPHFESFALASAGLQTKVALVTGIDAEKENQMNKLSEKIVKFRITKSIFEKLSKNGIPQNILKTIEESRRTSFVSEIDAEKRLTKSIGEEATKKYLKQILKASKIESNYFKNSDKGVLVGDRLATFLKLQVGDTLVLMGQGFQGVSAAGVFPILGIVKIPNPELDNQMIYMPLQACQEFYSAENLLTSISINIDNSSNMDEVKTQISSFMNSDKYEIMTWKEMLKELVQQIESDNYSGLIMLWILYLIVGFGVFGTVLMMTAERQKEFGVMVALGMQKRKLVVIVFIELLILAFIGILAGILLSLPIIRFYVVNPIELTGEMADMMESYGMEAVMPFAWQVDYFVKQSISVTFVILLAIIYPLIKILGINTMKALRG